MQLWLGGGEWGGGSGLLFSQNNTPSGDSVSTILIPIDWLDLAVSRQHWRGSAYIESLRVVVNL